MKTKFLLFLLLFVVITSFKQEIFIDTGKIVSAEEFTKTADTLGFKFVMPADYKEIAIKENKDLYYAFAIKNVKEDFEIRYSIWSLIPDLEEYKKCKLDTNCFMVDPNKTYSGRAKANILNMTSGEQMEFDGFPPAAVKKEFNGDAGGSAFFEFKCEFGKGYKYGQMVVLHKDNVADVIITYMSNDRQKHPDLMNDAFYSITFK